MGPYEIHVAVSYGVRETGGSLAHRMVQVKPPTPRRKRHHDPLLDATVKNKIECVLAAQRRRWSRPERLPLGSRAAELAKDKGLGYGVEAIRKILAGKYPAMARLRPAEGPHPAGIDTGAARHLH
jgi:hypothetical protein